MSIGSSDDRPDVELRHHIGHLNQRDLAARWQLSERTLERWRWLGRGPAFVKLGGSVRYLIDDIEAFEAAQRRRPHYRANPLFRKNR